MNPLALQIKNPDTVGKAFQGFEYGRQIAGENALAKYGMAASTGDKNALAAVYEADPNSAMTLQANAGKNATAENEARMAKFSTIGNIAGDIMRRPPEQRAAALEEAKGAIANMFGNDPQVMSVLGQVSPDNIQFYAEALTDEATRLKQELTGAKIGTEMYRSQDIAAGIGRKDAVAGAQIANISDQIGKRADGNAPGPGGAPMGKAPSGYQFTPEGTLTFIPGGPADPGRKVPSPYRMPATTVNKLATSGEAAIAAGENAAGFQDQFAGYGSDTAGDWANWEARNLGTGVGGQTPEGANWWQQYQSRKNQIRNDLFGSALTATEKAEFEKADITPGMQPEIIKDNLRRQNEVAMRAASKLAKAWLAQGAEPAAVEAALGIPLSDLGVNNAPAAPAGDVIRYDAEGNPL